MALRFPFIVAHLAEKETGAQGIVLVHNVLGFIFVAIYTMGAIWESQHS